MNLNSRFNLRKYSALACGVALALGVVAFRAKADQWDKRTILTVSQPIQITDRVLLDPGQYVLRLLDSQSDRHVVQIFNADQTRIINTVIAMPAYHQNVKGHTEFRFYETPPGYAKALKMWYYPGDNFGQEFAYPKQLYALTASTKTTETETQTAENTQQQEETPAPAVQEEAQNNNTEEQQTTEMAQNTPPAEQPQPEETPAPAPQPQQLPSTATPYPAIGLAGLAFMGLYGLLRFRSLA